MQIIARIGFVVFFFAPRINDLRRKNCNARARNVGKKNDREIPPRKTFHIRFVVVALLQSCRYAVRNQNRVIVQKCQLRKIFFNANGRLQKHLLKHWSCEEMEIVFTAEVIIASLKNPVFVSVKSESRVPFQSRFALSFCDVRATIRPSFFAKKAARRLRQSHLYCPPKLHRRPAAKHFRKSVRRNR